MKTTYSILSIMNEISNLNKNNFKILSNYKPSGDQPQAINELVDGLFNNERDQVLLGVTGLSLIHI